MFLDLKDLTDTELATKLNELHGRMRYMQQYGSGHSSQMYAQCTNWIEQITMEINERFIAEQTKDWESGTIDIVGEESEEAKDLGVKRGGETK